MQTEARVGVVVEGGGQRALNSVHGGGAADGRPTKLVQQNHQQQSLHQIGTVQQLLAGGIAGALAKTCTAPLARLTILFQVQGMHSDFATLRKASMWREASRIVSEEGFRAFWKGNLVTIAHRLPYSSVNFYAYEQYKKMLQMIPGLGKHGESISTNLCVHFIGGGLAGITAASVTYPLDLVRTRLSAQTNLIYYRGIWHSLRTITSEEGVLGLYKGLGATLLSVGPSIAVSFAVYESLRSSWQSHRPHDSTVLISLGSGSLSGIASSTGGLGYLKQSIIPATFPLDLLRRRMQLEGAGGRARVYTTGLLGTFRHIIRTEGLHGLYRGILPEYFKVMPGVGICFMTYETLKMLFQDVSSSD